MLLLSPGLTFLVLSLVFFFFSLLFFCFLLLPKSPKKNNLAESGGKKERNEKDHEQMNETGLHRESVGQWVCVNHGCWPFTNEPTT